MPAVGDKVRAEFIGTWTDTDKLKLPNNEEISVVSGVTGLPIATLVVLERKSLLVAGQVWQRISDGQIFTVVDSGTGKAVTPANTATGAPISEGSFNSGQFTLVFDPKEL